MVAAAIKDLLKTHPAHPATLDLLGRCAEACFACVRACTSCADACLSEEAIAELRECVRIALDCADICLATGRTVMRLTVTSVAPTDALLVACVEACRACHDACTAHAARYEHCRLCAEACRECERACEDLLDVIP
jgi:hypothetical protein